MSPLVSHTRSRNFIRVILILIQTAGRAQSPADPFLTKPPSVKEREEWIPTFLRTYVALPIAAICFVFVAVLEIVRYLIHKSEGIPLNQDKYVLPMRYLPTLCVVALGLLWKCVLGDIKRMMVWSVMSVSENGAAAEDSILLNYVGRLEVFSVPISIRKRHWAIFLGLLVGFLLGASVTVANTLTYSDLSAQTSNTTTLQKTSGFSFEGALADENGTLTMCTDHVGAQPYAAVSVQRFLEGQYSPWTNGKYAFESFQLASDQNSTEYNATLAGVVFTVASSFRCQGIDYKWDIDHYVPRGDARVNLFADQVVDSCSLSIRQDKGFSLGEWNTSSSGTQGWLNLTSCANNPDDTRIVATIIHPSEISSPDSNQTTLDVSTSGLVCSPTFTTQQANVQANATTGEITRFQMIPGTMKVADINASIEVVWQYLNNPTTYATLIWRDNVDMQLQTFDNDKDKVWSMVSHYTYSDDPDPFFGILLKNLNASRQQEFIHDAAVFGAEVETLAGATMTQVIHTLARTNSSEQFTGKTIRTEPKMLVQEVSLRILQGFLAFIGIAVLLLSTILRPRSVLHEDPGPLSQTAVIISSSHGCIDRKFSQHSRSSEKAMAEALRPARFRLLSETGGVLLTGNQNNPQTKTDRVSTADEIRPSDVPDRGWRPIAFRADAKAALLLAFIAVIVALGILQKMSQLHSGLSEKGTWPTRLYSFIPTLILVLLAYACSGIDAAIRSVISYKSLVTTSKKQPLLTKYRDFNFWTTMKLQSTRQTVGFAVVASSMVLILFPVIKIAAAGLYGTTLSSGQRDISIQLDSSLPELLESTKSASDASESAGNFAEWTTNTASDSRERPGILDNLVFSNISWLTNHDDSLTTPGDAVELTVPAILVDVNCTGLTDDMFNYTASGCGWTGSEVKCTLRVACVAEPCKELTDMDYLIYSYKSPYTGVVYYGPDTGNLNAYLSEYKDSDASTRGAVCSRALHLVDVKARFNQRTQRGLEDSVTVLPWSPSHFDRDSIKVRRTYNASDLPSWISPPRNYLALGGKQYAVDSGSHLDGDSLWPTDATSINFFNLLATYAEYKAGNLTSLLDPESLAVAAKEMYTAYTVQALTELRPFATGSLKDATATLFMQRERISQDLTSAIIVEALLFLVLCCLIWIFIRFPSSHILPKDPDTIATRFSLLAGSNLVQRLREDPSTRQPDAALWSEKAGLGWWPAPSSEGSSKRWRWGIDVGSGMIQQDWNHPPFENTPGKAPETTSASNTGSAIPETSGSRASLNDPPAQYEIWPQQSSYLPVNQQESDDEEARLSRRSSASAVVQSFSPIARAPTIQPSRNDGGYALPELSPVSPISSTLPFAVNDTPR